MTLLEQYEAKLKAKSEPKSLLEMVKEKMEGCSGLNETVYNEFIEKNREHQIKALNIIPTNSKGQIIIPTGTGKTRIQIATLTGDMIGKTKQNEYGVYVIASHRLLLNKQLMDEFLDLCVKCRLPINVLYIGSARHDDKAIYDRYFQYGMTGSTFKSAFTTTGEDVKKFYEETIEAHRHLILVSTYHSFDKLGVIDSIEMCAYDEAHNTTQDDFRANIIPVLPQIKRNYFFTATRKVCAIEGHGMENKDIYGEVLCDVSPQEMIDKGEVVSPRLITMTLDNEIKKGIVSHKDQHMLVKTVLEAFDKNKGAVKEDSGYPDQIGTKLLVSFVGSEELSLVHDSEEFREECQKKGIKVFSFSSRYGTFINFKEEQNRDNAYEQMKALKDEEDCILLHIDILAEGVDLPSITGVLLLRHLNEIKLFQTLGRALRLMKVDRQRFYDGKISPDDPKGYMKPRAYLILPLHFENMDTSSEDMRSTIQAVLSTYGIPIEEFLPPEGFRFPETVYIDPVTNNRMIAKIKKSYPLISIIEDFVMQEFERDLPKEHTTKYEALTEFLKRLGDLNA